MRLIAKLLLLIVGVSIFKELGALGHKGGGVIFNIAVVAFATFVATAVHELGHAFAVLAVRGRVDAINVIPVEMRFRPARLMFASGADHGDLGGFVHHTLGGRESPGRQLVIAAAGPLANAVLAVAAARAILLFGNERGFDVLVALWLMSAGVGLANLIPFDRSDGAHILEASRQMLRMLRQRSS